ncbi:MAG: hypothetical protein ABI614_14455 [Planctomycetota bacterium]
MHAAAIRAAIPKREPPPKCDVPETDMVAPPIADQELWEIHELAKEALSENNLRPLLAERLSIRTKMGIILLHWTRSIQIDRPGFEIGKTTDTAFFDWARSTMTPKELAQMWNSSFPSYTLAKLGCASVRSEILCAMRTLRDLHG